MAKVQHKLKLSKRDMQQLIEAKRICSEIAEFLPPNHPSNPHADSAYNALIEVCNAGPEFDLAPKPKTVNA